MEELSLQLSEAGKLINSHSQDTLELFCRMDLQADHWEVSPVETLLQYIYNAEERLGRTMAAPLIYRAASTYFYLTINRKLK